MDTFVSLLLFLLVFFIIVVGHEFGHYIVSKINGVRVIEFTVGMGPKLIGFHKNGTDYTLRALPFGGACIYDMGQEATEVMAKAEGVIRAGANAAVSYEATESPKDETDPGLAGADDGFLNEDQGIPYIKAPLMTRIAIVLAGPIFNIIVAYLLALIVVWNTGSYNAEITGLIEGYPAMEAGIKEGDIITSMNGSKVYTAQEIYLNTYLNEERPMTIKYLRDGKEYSVTVTPKYDEEIGRYLVGFNGYGTYIDCKNINVFKCSYYEVRYAFVGTGKSLIRLLVGRGSKDDVAGPIGMASAIDDVKDAAAPYGPWVVMLNIFNIAMLLSVNLGVLNMLPLPAIDGGKFMFLLLEALRGKPVPPEKEGIVHLVGFALFALLAIFVMYNDIMRIIAK